ncbi:MAG: zinc ribbon domain-containing protein [Promethearchaeota archaeon]
MEKVRSQIILEPGERLYGIYITQKNSNTWNGSKEGEDGALVLTTKRLLFYKSKGAFSKSYDLINTIYLRDVISIDTGGRIIKHIAVNGVKYFPKGVSNKTLAEMIRINAQKLKGQKLNVRPVSQNIQQTMSINMASDPAIAPIQAQPFKGVIYCTQCGFQNADDANFCNKCGTSLN